MIYIIKKIEEKHEYYDIISIIFAFVIYFFYMLYQWKAPWDIEVDIQNIILTALQLRAILYLLDNWKETFGYSILDKIHEGSKYYIYRFLLIFAIIAIYWRLRTYYLNEYNNSLLIIYDLLLIVFLFIYLVIAKGIDEFLSDKKNNKIIVNSGVKFPTFSGLNFPTPL